MSFSLDDIVVGGRFKALFVSPSGGGKTVAAASILQLADELVTKGQLKPEQAKTYMFDLDGRYAVIRKMYPQLVGKGLLEFDHYSEKDYEKLHKKVNQIADQFESNPRKYFAVILDGLTVLANTTMQYAMSLNAASEKTQLGVLAMPQIQDYKGETRAVAYLMSTLKELPCHFILTAHETSYEIKNNNGEVVGQERVLVTQGRKTAPQVPIFFNEMYYFKTEPNGVPGDPASYVCYTSPVLEWPGARTALNGVPGKIDCSMKPGDKGLFPRLMEHVNKWNAEHPTEANKVEA